MAFIVTLAFFGFRLVFLLCPKFILMVVRFFLGSPLKCHKQNEVYACHPREETCDYTYTQDPPNPSCKKGCYCVLGYVRNHEGECVLRSQHCRSKRSIGDDLFNTTETEDREVLLLDTPIGISYQKGHVHIHF